MPIYELACRECLIVQEVRCTYAATAEIFCPECGGCTVIEPSLPARVRVGKYGKAGGLDEISTATHAR